MGLFLRQDGGRSELQSKIAADLQERLKESQAPTLDEHEPAFNEGRHQTRPAGAIIMLLLFALLIAVGVWLLRLGGIL